MAVHISPESVCAAIDITLDPKTLPDSVIQSDIYEGAALAEVYARDPSYATRTEAQQARLSRAANLICAALLIDAIPALTEERDEFGGTYKRNQEKVTERIARLRARADSEITAVIGDGTASFDMPEIFARAEGTRGL